MGRKPLDPQERKVNMTIRLGPDSLESINFILDCMRDVQKFIHGQACDYRFPKNRTELVSKILEDHISAVSKPFMSMALDLTLANLGNDEDFSSSMEAFRSRWPEYEGLANAIEASRKEKQKAEGYETRLKELEKMVAKLKSNK